MKKGKGIQQNTHMFLKQVDTDNGVVIEGKGCGGGWKWAKCVWGD